MYLTLKEMEKLMISVAAEVAEKRLKRGLKLNYPEAVALITEHVLEAARDGKLVADVMQSARKILKVTDVMPGVPSMIHLIQVEATFLDGTKLVSAHEPITE